jgi:hypothetical protein
LGCPNLSFPISVSERVFVILSFWIKVLHRRKQNATQSVLLTPNEQIGLVGMDDFIPSTFVVSISCHRGAPGQTYPWEERSEPWLDFLLNALLCGSGFQVRALSVSGTC